MVLLALQPPHTTILHRQRRSIHHRQQRRCVLRRNSKATKLLLPIRRLAPHDLACRWKDGLVGTSTAAHCHPTSTKSKYQSSQTEKVCLETEFESYEALVLVRPISRLAPHDFACRWKDGLVGTSTAAHYHPTSTKAKYPSSQTEKMCLETEFESYEALLVVAVSPISRLSQHDLACRWKDGLVRTSTAAHYHPTSTKAQTFLCKTEDYFAGAIGLGLLLSASAKEPRFLGRHSAVAFLHCLGCGGRRRGDAFDWQAAKELAGRKRSAIRSFLCQDSYSSDYQGTPIAVELLREALLVLFVSRGGGITSKSLLLLNSLLMMQNGSRAELLSHASIKSRMVLLTTSTPIMSSSFPSSIYKRNQVVRQE
eukprot:scaffold10239_cov71-Skeletonema_dohrnii-CCMP3373.AAC.2